MNNNELPKINCEVLIQNEKQQIIYLNVDDRVLFLNRCLITDEFSLCKLKDLTTNEKIYLIERIDEWLSN